MKREISVHQLFKNVDREMNNHEMAFAEKTEVLAAKTEFGNNNDKIGDILSQLMRPISTLRSTKQDSETRMRKSTSQMIGIGITLATSLDNQPMLSTLKNYDTQWRRCSAYQLYEISLHTCEELSNVQVVATGNGLTVEKLAAFQKKIKDYGETLDSAGYQLSDRRKSRKELKALVKANFRILRLQLDPFVRYSEDEFPELYKNYMFLRRRKPAKKSTTIIEDEPVEIMGTVTDSVTGLPIVDATINIVDQSIVESTDADGCYVLEEIRTSTCVVHCYANNYEVPEPVSLTAASGESLVVDFSLTPVTPTEETPTT